MSSLIYTAMERVAFTLISLRYQIFNLLDFNPDLLDTAIVKNNLGLKVMLYGTIRNDDF